MHELAIDTSNHTGQITIVDANRHLLADANANLDQVMRERIAQKKRFFSIEVSPMASVEPLNFDAFRVPPMFTSITWLKDTNLRQKSLEDAPAIQLEALIRPSNPAMLHLTCYKLNEKSLKQVLSFGVENFLVLKGGE